MARQANISIKPHVYRPTVTVTAAQEEARLTAYQTGERALHQTNPGQAVIAFESIYQAAADLSGWLSGRTALCGLSGRGGERCSTETHNARWISTTRLPRCPCRTAVQARAAGPGAFCSAHAQLLRRRGSTGARTSAVPVYEAPRQRPRLSQPRLVWRILKGGLPSAPTVTVASPFT